MGHDGGTRGELGRGEDQERPDYEERVQYNELESRPGSRPESRPNSIEEIYEAERKA